MREIICINLLERQFSLFTPNNNFKAQAKYHTLTTLCRLRMHQQIGDK